MFRNLQHAIGLTVLTALAPLMVVATPDAAHAQTRSEAQPAKVAVAVAAPTYSFGTAAGPGSGWIQIEPQTSNWFKFKYDYDNSDSDNEPTQALVNLKMEQAGCVSFEVWTPGRLRDPQHADQEQNSRNDRVTPVGAGTPYSKGSVTVDGEERAQLDVLNLTWAGSATASDTYYIVVKNKTNAACNYSLSISGPDVSF
jgi:hypothetical protein